MTLETPGRDAAARHANASRAAYDATLAREYAAQLAQLAAVIAGGMAHDGGQLLEVTDAAVAAAETIITLAESAAAKKFGRLDPNDAAKMAKRAAMFDPLFSGFSTALALLRLHAPKDWGPEDVGGTIEGMQRILDQAGEAA